MFPWGCEQIWGENVLADWSPVWGFLWPSSLVKDPEALILSSLLSLLWIAQVCSTALWVKELSSCTSQLEAISWLATWKVLMNNRTLSSIIGGPRAASGPWFGATSFQHLIQMCSLLCMGIRYLPYILGSFPNSPSCSHGTASQILLCFEEVKIWFFLYQMWPDIYVMTLTGTKKTVTSALF